MKLAKIPRPGWLGPRFEADFSGRRPRAPALAWGVLACGAAALAGATALLTPGLSERNRLLAERASLQMQIQHRPGGAAATRSASATELIQARAVLDELGRPWKQLFDRFESVDVPKVYLIQLAVDSRFQGVQMITEAARLDDLLQYSRELGGEGPLRSIRLTHHEWRSAPGARVVVASLTAELSRADDTPSGVLQ